MNSNKIVPIREQIAEQLRLDIITGSLEAGEKLNEQQLADRFGVSRGPIRDVLLQLSKEGLLLAKNNCGVTVNSALDRELQELMKGIRRHIETFAIQKVIETLDQRDFDALEKILHKLDTAFSEHDYGSVTAIDIDFHHYIVSRAGGTELTNLWHPMILRMRMNYQRIGTSHECVGEHKDILDALKQKDTQAAVAALEANIR